MLRPIKYILKIPTRLLVRYGKYLIKSTKKIGKNEKIKVPVQNKKTPPPAPKKKPKKTAPDKSKIKLNLSNRRNADLTRQIQKIKTSGNLLQGGSSNTNSNDPMFKLIQQRNSDLIRKLQTISKKPNAKSLNPELQFVKRRNTELVRSQQNASNTNMFGSSSEPYDNLKKLKKAPWVHSWRSYLYKHQDELDARTADLLSGLNSKSQRAAQITLNRFMHAVPASDAPFELFVSKSQYLDEDEYDPILKKTYQAELADVHASNPELKGFYLPIHSVVHHGGINCFPKEVQQSLHGTDFIDGGACWGDSAFFFQRHKPKRIFSYEPDPTNFQLLTKLPDLVDYNNLVAINSGLSNEVAELEFFSQGRECNIGATLHPNPNTKQTAEIVKVTTIDTLLTTYEDVNIGFLKLDIEGNELEAILGAKKIIHRDTPALSIAIYHRPQDFFEIKPLLESWDLNYKFEIRRFIAGEIFGVYLLAHTTS